MLSASVVSGKVHMPFCFLSKNASQQRSAYEYRNIIREYEGTSGCLYRQKLRLHGMIGVAKRWSYRLPSRPKKMKIQQKTSIVLRCFQGLKTVSVKLSLQKHHACDCRNGSRFRAEDAWPQGNRNRNIRQLTDFFRIDAAFRSD